MQFSPKRITAWVAVALALIGGAYHTEQKTHLEADHQRIDRQAQSPRRQSSGDQQAGTAASSAAEAADSAASQSSSDDQLADLQFQNGSTGIVQVNHNQPTISYADFRTPQIKYTQLDQLHRAGTATAYLTKQNLGRSAGRGRQIWKPTGWHNQPKYVNGKRVFPQNRGHLIAYTMTFNLDQQGRFQQGALGSEDNPLNLATQSAYSNQVLMQIYEQKVRDALAHGQKVIYQVTPVFKGNELMPRGYHLQAVSNTGALKFNVYLENIQPGIRFNYQTGQSQVDPNVKVQELNQ